MFLFENVRVKLGIILLSANIRAVKSSCNLNFGSFSLNADDRK